MTKFKKLLAATAASVAMLGGIAYAQTKDAKDVTIGFLQRTMTAPYYVAMWKEAERLAAEKGFKLVASQADGDAVKQMQQLEDMVAKGVDAVVMNAVDPVTTETAVKEAVESGLQIVFIDTEVPGVGANATFGADNEGIGRLAGEIMAKRVGPGPIKIGILEGAPEDKFVGPAREKGFLSGLDAGGAKYEVVVRGQAKYAQDLAVPATEDMLTAHSDLDVIFGYNDAMALGALSVLKPESKILVAGIDGQKEAFKAIKDGGCKGKYVSSGLNSPTLAAHDGFSLALDIATGAKEPTHDQKFIFTKVAGIGCENIDAFYDENSAF
ncbi:substrate-binding domain-containing protein [Ensifer sp. ENS06]|uniref:sugar ABC transporter substrate-binding protein n=1 Tax=Ensifer sp. ENS06 TaxID=2769276 RepID=UPI0017874F6E|nr:substrate-binding domain-containing protein [Ensifer sp. ENS06]MBD9626950.1 substrate-binding domain-containing protein [Ensifer sp. ENS06]